MCVCHVAIQAFSLLHMSSSEDTIVNWFLTLTFCLSLLTVRRDVQENDEEAVRVKEQSILELGSLLAKTGQAAGSHQTYFCFFNPTNDLMQLSMSYLYFLKLLSSFLFLLIFCVRLQN